MRKFNLTVTEETDGNFTIKTLNDGFNSAELIGFLECKKNDILDQIRFPEKFIKHQRTIVIDGEQMSIEEVDDQ